MSDNCPQCGMALASDAPAGLCPACLMKAGLESSESDFPNPEMAESDKKQLQELFLETLEQPPLERESWLRSKCGSNEKLFREVLSFLQHDNPTHDPLKQKLRDARVELPRTAAFFTGEDESITNQTEVDSKGFLSNLADVGVLSLDEIKALNQSIGHEHTSDPREMAAELVSQGKLTQYQASALLKGQPDLLLDKYIILDLIGVGGMGMVFKANHRPMNRMVAVKMISQNLLNSQEQVKRFQREVRVAATLEHPHIVRAYDADQVNGVHFLVLEYVRGENLAETVDRDGPLSLQKAVDAIVQAARGLGYAHEQGIVHRDVKPGNLMRNRKGEVKVLDLGLANVDENFRLAQRSSVLNPGEASTPHPQAGASNLTQAGAVLGTVAYMAPEQSLKADAADARSDVYALGCTLYYLLTGEPPYCGETVVEIFAQHRDGEIPSLGGKRPDVPASVDAVCRRMLAKSPDVRYQSMEELIAALEACGIPGQNFSAMPSPFDRKNNSGRARLKARPAEGSQHGRTKWLAYGLFLLAIVGGSYVMSQFLGQRGNRDQRERDKHTQSGVPPTRRHAPAVNDPAATAEWLDDAPALAIAPFDVEQARRHQEEWAEYLGLPVETEFELMEGAELLMVMLPPGEFLMGGSEHNLGPDEAHPWELTSVASERPQHLVRITRPFLIGKYEVTQAQWEAVMGSNPSRFRTSESHPVERISWNDAQLFIEKLNDKLDLDDWEFVLPTEAEWEYACRAGTTTPWHSGNDADDLMRYAWVGSKFNPDLDHSTHPVGKLLPNAFRLNEMHGNVAEWCADWFGNFYTNSPRDDPSGPTKGDFRIRRGGAFPFRPFAVRSGYRDFIEPTRRSSLGGCRVAARLIERERTSNAATSPSAADLLATSD